SLEDLSGLKRRFAADAGATRGPGAAAIGRLVGIAEDDADLLHRYAEHAAEDLRRQRLRALPLFGDAGLDEPRALRIEPHRDAILRGDFGAADAIKCRARIGDLDEARNADAAMNVLLAQARLLGAQRVVVHHLEQLVQGLMMRQQLETQARSRRARISIVGDEVTPANLDRVHADFHRGKIDQSFSHRTGNGMADRAILAHHIFILEYHAGTGAVVLRRIGAADEVDDLVGFDRAGARIHRIRTDAGKI